MSKLFKIFKNNSEKNTVEIIFLIDTSGSMNDEIEEVKKSCELFADKISVFNNNVKMGLIGFDIGGHRSLEKVNYKVINLSKYTIGIWPKESPKNFKNNIQTLSLNLFGGGGCYIANKDSVDIFPEVIKSFEIKSNNSKILVLISDEIGNESGLKQIVSELNKASVTTFVLGVSSRKSHKAIAEETGGEFWDIKMTKGIPSAFYNLLDIVSDRIAETIKKKFIVNVDNSRKFKINKNE